MHPIEPLRCRPRNHRVQRCHEPAVGPNRDYNDREPRGRCVCADELFDGPHEHGVVAVRGNGKALAVRGGGTQKKGETREIDWLQGGVLAMDAHAGHDTRRMLSDYVVSV